MVAPRRLTELAAAIGDLADIPDGQLVVGLSGGADSAALAWFLTHAGHPVRAVHVHHGYPASDRLAGAAGDVARTLSIELETVAVSPSVGASPEARARTVRYEAFEACLAAGEWLVTAHTLDDQAETVMERLLRGAGPDGLAGIPSRRPPFARPILGVSRSVTREVAVLAGLPFFDDPSNEDVDILRNRIRTRLLPDLEAQFSPSLRAHLAHSADLVGAERDHVEETTAGRPQIRADGAVTMAAAMLATAGEVAAARLARRLLVAAGIESPARTAIESVLDVANGRAEKRNLGRTTQIVRSDALVVIGSKAIGQDGPVPLATPGDAEFNGWAFDAFVVESPPPLPLGLWTMVADADEVGNLQVVAAETIDHSLESVLASAGVPEEDRAAYPVVVSVSDPLWVPCVKRFPLGWVSTSSERYLVVRTRSDGHV